MSKLMERYEREKAEKTKSNCYSDEEVEIDRYTAEKQFYSLMLMISLAIGVITIMGYMSR